MAWRWLYSSWFRLSGRPVLDLLLSKLAGYAVAGGLVGDSSLGFVYLPTATARVVFNVSLDSWSFGQDSE